jgi:glucosamine-6-phosphate deaminase
VVVPDERKANAVVATLTAPISPLVPASILRTHHDVTIFADEAAMDKVPVEVRKAFTT